MNSVRRLLRAFRRVAKFAIVLAVLLGLAGAILIATEFTALGLSLFAIAILILLCIIIDRQREQRRLVAEIWKQRNAHSAVQQDISEARNALLDAQRSTATSLERISKSFDRRITELDDALSSESRTAVRALQHLESRIDDVEDAVIAGARGVPPSWARLVADAVHDADCGRPVVFLGSHDTFVRASALVPAADRHRLLHLDPADPKTLASTRESATWNCLVLESSEELAGAGRDGNLWPRMLRWLPSNAPVYELSHEDAEVNRRTLEALADSMTVEFASAPVSERVRRIAVLLDLGLEPETTRGDG